MSAMTVLIKPASSSCNMVCNYCFYDDVSNCRLVKNHGLMEGVIWKKLVDQVLDIETLSTVTFAFQGGEPLLAGERFFRRFIEYVEENKGMKDIHYTVQTNGTMLNDSFCELFKENNFLVGISIDGFKENHDRHRTFRGVGAFNDVYKGFQLLKKHQIPFNTLTVLTKNLAKHPKKLYDFYVKESINHIQIIPCLPSFHLSVEEDLFACEPDLFESFYISFYEAWKLELESGVYRSIQLFNDIVFALNGRRAQQCGFHGSCSPQCVVEADGTVYPCDFYVIDEYALGSVSDKNVLAMLQSQEVANFLKRDTKTYPEQCASCMFRNLCNGGCPRLRETYLSESKCGLKKIFEIIYEDFSEIMSLLHRSVPANESSGEKNG